jgi:hypothetical protein
MSADCCGWGGWIACDGGGGKEILFDLNAVIGRLGRLPLIALEAGEPLMERFMEPSMLEKLGRGELTLEKLGLGEENGDGCGERRRREWPWADGK